MLKYETLENKAFNSNELEKLGLIDCGKIGILKQYMNKNNIFYFNDKLVNNKIQYEIYTVVKNEML